MNTHPCTPPCQFEYSIGIKYDLKEVGGWSYCLGYSHCPGFEDLEVNMELASGEDKDITVDYLSASTINLAIDRNWRIGKANIFYLEFGYAIPLQSNRWRVTDGSAISSISKSVLNMLQPGGLILEKKKKEESTINLPLFTSGNYKCTQTTLLTIIKWK